LFSAFSPHHPPPAFKPDRSESKRFAFTLWAVILDAPARLLHKENRHHIHPFWIFKPFGASLAGRGSPAAGVCGSAFSNTRRGGLALQLLLYGKRLVLYRRDIL
jgi:hypothetical protein